MQRSPSDALAPDVLRAENEAMRCELELLRDALERMPHGMCAFGGDDRLVLANARYRKIWDLPPDVVRPGATFRQIIEATPGQETAASRSRPQPAPGTEGTRWREWQLDDGRIVEIVVSRRADGSCVALHEDVTEQRKAQERISFLARHDLLTGLPNRTVLREELERALASNRRGETLALLCLDLDRFKPVNDTYGHAAGDDLLRQVAARLRHCVREVDVVTRIGGDEFAVVQRGATHPEGSTRLGQRIIEALTSPFEVEGHVVHIGTSVGVALAPMDGEDAETLLRHGDLALYRAKSEGRGQVSYFEPAMNERIEARRGIENGLRQGDRARPAGAALPAAVRRARRPAGRGRGAGALAPPATRPGAAGRVHPAGRGDRPDRADRALGARASLPGCPVLAAPPDRGRQRVRRAVRARRGLERRASRAVRVRPAGAPARAGDHRDQHDQGPDRGVVRAACLA